MPMHFDTTHDWQDFDRKHLWHPYTSMRGPLPTYPVVRAEGVYLELADGRRLVDGMSSWWTAIHGYDHPVLNAAAKAQIDDVAHVMFGGVAHQPASELGARLVELTPESLDYVFLSDSGSVSVEVAMKLAVQYWTSLGQPSRSKFLAPRGGYHGDTLNCMSVSDPENGMHHMFEPVLPEQVFVSRPEVGFYEDWDDSDLLEMEQAIQERGHELAGVILEPILQGVGGMRFYHPKYLRGLRELCDRHDLLLIFDEIATGFGRTGKMFAAEHAGVVPDIMCVGKAMTGGFMSLAATLTNDRVVDAVDAGPHPVLMHGPTFMGNPLACAVSVANIDLLTASDWESEVTRIGNHLRTRLSHLATDKNVADVRTLGAIAVVETAEPVDLARTQQILVEAGAWIRPYGRLIYVMPPYITSNAELDVLATAIERVVDEFPT